MRLLERMMELQERHGYLRADDLRALAESARVPLYRLEGLASFYTHFRRTPPKPHTIHLCRDMSCWLANGPAIAEQVRQRWSSNGEVEIAEASCLGRCDAAPAATLNDVPVPASALLDAEPATVAAGFSLRNAPKDTQARACGYEVVYRLDGERWRCDPYATDGERYAAIRRTLEAARSKSASDSIIAELKTAGLRGMGGAGFSTGLKWELVRKETREPKYVICNADESEPGTFKDRVILRELPHLVIEGMLLAGLTVGARHGIVFIRHHYDPERRVLEAALGSAQSAGLLGKNILGSGMDFEIEVFVSPGGYILGEETALLEALEDRRGEPRNKPPFPGTHGLYGLPTLINNVETLAMVPGIALRGGEWWKSQGRPGFAGLKFLAVSGHVARPGVYEAAMGTPVRELLDRAGGVTGGQPLLAFAPGGASSNFLFPDKLDTPLDFTAMAQAGSMLGSGALVVVAEGTNLLALGANVTRFFRNESCGKCVPCRVGTEKAAALLDAHLSGPGDHVADARELLEVLGELNDTLCQTSICGLGQVALGPVLSVFKDGVE